MRKFLSLFAFIIVFFVLASCSSGQNSSSEGEEEIERMMELEERFEKGYDVGFSEGYDFGYEDCEAHYEFIIEDAKSYARDEGGWSVYEAYTNVFIYLDGYAPEGCDFPTWQEYQESIITLASFCEYLDTHR